MISDLTNSPKQAQQLQTQQAVPKLVGIYVKKETLALSHQPAMSLSLERPPALSPVDMLQSIYYLRRERHPTLKPGVLRH